MLAQVGLPEISDVKTPKEYAIGLLKIAAEIEHALMVQYLFTADTMLTAVGDEDTYRKKLRNVAIQEMGHLATVQNLLLLLGGPSAFYMQRDVLRRDSEANPIPMIFEPVSLAALAKYLAAEAPESPPPDVAEKVRRLVKIAADDAGFDPRRVGAIYAVLKWMFMEKSAALAWMRLPAIGQLTPNPHLEDGDLVDPLVISAYEAVSNEWGDDREDFLLLNMRTRGEAVTAIDEIARQGEGFDGAEDSHFKEFLEIIDSFEKNEISAKPITTSPTLGDGHGGDRGVRIDNPYTRLWAEVQSLQYALLCLSILHSLATPRNDEAQEAIRAGLIRIAIEGMRKHLDPLSKLLSSLPMQHNGVAFAGPCFDLDPMHLHYDSVTELPPRHLAILDRLEQVYAAIEAAVEFRPDSNDSTTLFNLKRFDRKRRNLINSIPVSGVA